MMKQIAINRIGLIAVAIVMVATLALPAVVSAQRGEGQARGEQARVAAEERRRTVDEARDDRLTEIQERVQERRAQVLLDVCERRQDQFSQLIPRLANQSTRLQSAIDIVYERIQGFYETGQLTVDNYDELNEVVAASQTEAEAAVQAVVSFEFEFDCDNPSVGDQTYGFREATSGAREALKDYRANLVVLISSLRAAAEQANTDFEESGDNGRTDSDNDNDLEEDDEDA